MTDAAKFVGTWSLKSFEATGPDGARVHPLGEDAVGRITYHADGRMSVQVMSADRPPFSGGDPLRAPDAEAARAFATYLGYLGTYTVDPEAGQVVHHLTVASVPNWVGTEQRRFYEFSDRALQLSTPPIVLDGVALRSVLVWERD